MVFSKAEGGKDNGRATCLRGLVSLHLLLHCFILSPPPGHAAFSHGEHSAKPLAVSAYS